MNINVVQCDYGGADQKAAIALRSKVLREPLGLRFTDEQLAAESTQLHFVAKKDAVVVGCFILAPKSAREIQIRQVAVDSVLQGQGIGHLMMVQAESFARAHGYEEIVLHARESAVKFYRSLGYETKGEGFSEIGIPHYKMFKKIARSLP